MALRTNKVSARWTGEGMITEVGTRGFTVRLDEPLEMGGQNVAMTPTELLLCSLAGCTAVMVSLFAPQLGVTLQDVRMDVEGDMDLAGVQGVDPHVRPGFQSVRTKLTIVSDSPREKVSQLAQLAIARCPVTDTLKGVTLRSSYEVIRGDQVGKV